MGSKRQVMQIVAPPAAGEGDLPLSETQRKTARKVSRAIQLGVKILPFPLVCLPQAIAGQWMLRRRDLPSQIYFGILITAPQDPEFHAWLKSRHVWITGHCDEALYAVFTERDTSGS